VAAQLDATTSSRATQASVDAIAATALTINGSVAGLLPEIRSRASQDSLNALSIGLTSVETVMQHLSDTLPSGSVIADLQAKVGDMSTRMTALKSAVDAMSSSASRMAIERALNGARTILALKLPASAGGQLETVRQVVADCITGMLQSGARVPRAATAAFAKGEAAYAVGDYAAAYTWFAKAYKELG
jgi:hypothetical protein